MNTDRPIVTSHNLIASYSEPISLSRKLLNRGEEAFGVYLDDAYHLIVGFNQAIVMLKRAEEKSKPDLLVTVDHKIACLLQSFYAEAKLGQIVPKFSDMDRLGWIGSVLTWWRMKGREPHHWVPATYNAAPFANETKMALLGDWGTGLYGAPVSAKSIEADHQKCIENGQTGYGVLMHLGDVYYSGTSHEVQSEFIHHWPKIEGSINRALNSNHEMYSGGYGYFKILKEFDQQASYFALQNDHWLLVGLDTAYDDKDWLYDKAAISEDQVAWLKKMVQAAEHRKIILFTHHQPLSYFEAPNPRLKQQLQWFLTNNNFFAWYWGHEHRCILYDKHPLWSFYGRCIGHGGYPYLRDKQPNFETVSKGPNDTRWLKCKEKSETFPSTIVLDGPNEYVENYQQECGTQGYLTLEFSNEHLNELVHTPDGIIIKTTQLA